MPRSYAFLGNHRSFFVNGGSGAGIDGSDTKLKDQVIDY